MAVIDAALGKRQQPPLPLTDLLYGGSGLTLMKNHFDRLPGKVLTVVLRDDSPMIHCQDSPTYRSVRIELTDEQRKEIALHCTGTTGGTPIYESVSKCFIEPESGD